MALDIRIWDEELRDMLQWVEEAAGSLNIIEQEKKATLVRSMFFS